MLNCPRIRSLFLPLMCCIAMPVVASPQDVGNGPVEGVLIIQSQSEPERVAPEEGVAGTLVLTAEALALPGGQIEMKKVAFLGVSTSPVAPQLASQLKLPEGFGLVVDHVQAAEPAEKAGLRNHDVLVRMGDQKLVNAMQLGTLVRAHKPGDVVDITIIREGKEMIIKATLIEKEVPAADVLFSPHDVIIRGEEGDLPRIKWLQRVVPGEMWEQKIMRGSVRFADGEHQLEIKNDKDGKTLIVQDKAGKEIFTGPINTPEQRKAVPEAVQPKLEKLEKSTRVQIQRLPRGFDPGQLPGGLPGHLPSGEFDFDIELNGPMDADRIKGMIEKQLKGLPLEGAQADELKKRIDEMKKQVDEMMQKAAQQQQELRGRIQRGELPVPPPGAPGAPGDVQRHEFRQAQAMARMNDGTHQITLKSDQAGRHLTISDKDGKEIFSGPINTVEEKEKVPAELRGKVQQLEKSVKLDVIGSGGQE